MDIFCLHDIIWTASRMFNQISTGDMTWDMLKSLIFYDLGGFFYGRTVQNCNSVSFSF